MFYRDFIGHLHQTHTWTIAAKEVMSLSLWYNLVYNFLFATQIFDFCFGLFTFEYWLLWFGLWNKLIHSDSSGSSSQKLYNFLEKEKEQKILLCFTYLNVLFIHVSYAAEIFSVTYLIIDSTVLVEQFLHSSYQLESVRLYLSTQHASVDQHDLSGEAGWAS